MKVIRIFLLVLIIIGIIALITQKIWVPKLIVKILSSEHIPIVTLLVVQPNITLVDGHQCYTYSHKATTNEPYDVNEFLDITIKNNNVTGTKTGTQKGPDMTNGYKGTFKGTVDKKSGKINSIFSYIIEGSYNQEKEIYRTNKTGIEKLRYPLIEEKGILVPDTTKKYTLLHYSRVGCSASN